MLIVRHAGGVPRVQEAGPPYHRHDFPQQPGRLEPPRVCRRLQSLSGGGSPSGTSPPPDWSQRTKPRRVPTKASTSTRRSGAPEADRQPRLRTAVLYARVSSKDQEKEGFSIPAQQALLKKYAAEQGLKSLEEFVDVETAKRAGRTQFTEMLRFIKKKKTCKIILVEKSFVDLCLRQEVAKQRKLPKRCYRTLSWAGER